MLAMQGGPLIGRSEASWPGWVNEGSNAQEKMKRLMDLPATDDLEWTRHDRWTALMEACNFGHKLVVELLIRVPNIDFEAVNLRGQRAEEVASSRGHESLAQLIRKERQDRENPEELPRIQELEQEVENLKNETRQRLLASIERKYVQLRELKSNHETEIEPLSRKIDTLQEQLEEAMKQRLSMITRQVREIKAYEDEIRQIKRKLENFDRYASTGNLLAQSAMGASGSSLQVPSGSNPDLSVFDKDFECSVCLEEMKPPVKIFQCRNGHVMCETCKNHPEVLRCPSCRIPLHGQAANLMRNIPMEKLARSYYEKVTVGRSRPHSRCNSRNTSRRGSASRAVGGAIVGGPSQGRGLEGTASLSQSTDTAFLEWMQ